MPDISTVHIDQALTNLSIMYMNEDLVADQVFPPLPVDKSSDKYFVYGQGDFISGSGLDAQGNPRSLRKDGAIAAEVDFTLSTDSYNCKDYALAQLVTDAVVKKADSPLQPDIDATMNTTTKVKMDNEIQVARLIGNPANYNAAYQALLTTGAAGSSWLQYSSVNSLPLNNLRDAKVAVKRGVLREANTALFTMYAAQVLADHPTIKDLVKYTNVDTIMSSGLPHVLRGLTTVEASQVMRTSAEGVTPVTTGDVWVAADASTICLVYYRSADTGARSIHFGRTFDCPDDTTNVRGFQVRRWRDEPRKGSMLECSVKRDHKIIAKDQPNNAGLATGGYLISGCTN